MLWISGAYSCLYVNLQFLNFTKNISNMAKFCQYFDKGSNHIGTKMSADRPTNALSTRWRWEIRFKTGCSFLGRTDLEDSLSMQNRKMSVSADTQTTIFKCSLVTMLTELPCLFQTHAQSELNTWMEPGNLTELQAHSEHKWKVCLSGISTLYEPQIIVWNYGKGVQKPFSSQAVGYSNHRHETNRGDTTWLYHCALNRVIFFTVGPGKCRVEKTDTVSAVSAIE